MTVPQIIRRTILIIFLRSFFLFSLLNLRSPFFGMLFLFCKISKKNEDKNYASDRKGNPKGKNAVVAGIRRSYTLVLINIVACIGGSFKNDGNGYIFLSRKVSKKGIVFIVSAFERPAPIKSVIGIFPGEAEFPSIFRFWMSCSWVLTRSSEFWNTRQRK